MSHLLHGTRIRFHTIKEAVNGKAGAERQNSWSRAAVGRGGRCVRGLFSSLSFVVAVNVGSKQQVGSKRMCGGGAGI